VAKEKNSMTIHPEPRKMSVEEYFALESDPSTKYEYRDGYAVAMSGTSLNHVRITRNISHEFTKRMQEGPCQAYSSDVRVIIPTRGNYLLPDIAVSCDYRDEKEDQALHFPRLIIEVLSPSTQDDDRSEKFQEYQTLPSLQEYVLVSARYQFVEIYRRQSDETWLYKTYKPDQIVEFKCLNIQLTFAEIYKNVEVPAKFDLVKELQEKYTIY